MSPKKRVSGDAVVDVLRDMEKPYATTTDIAEGLDVTNQTIRNNATKLEQHPRINKGKVGQSSVYWFESDDTYRKSSKKIGGLKQMLKIAEGNENISLSISFLVKNSFKHNYVPDSNVDKVNIKDCGWVNHKKIETATLNESDGSFDKDIMKQFAKFKHPPDYGVTGELRAYVYDDECEGKTPRDADNEVNE